MKDLKFKAYDKETKEIYYFSLKDLKAYEGEGDNIVMFGPTRTHITKGTIGQYIVCNGKLNKDLDISLIS